MEEQRIAEEKLRALEIQRMNQMREVLMKRKAQLQVEQMKIKLIGMKRIYEEKTKGIDTSEEKPFTDDQPFKLFSRDILIAIFRKCSPTVIAKTLTLVCKTWRNVAIDNVLWVALVEKPLPNQNYKREYFKAVMYKPIAQIEAEIAQLEKTIAQ